MLGASFLPAWFRSADGGSSSSRPNLLNRRISPVLQSLSRRACTHPIHTIVFVALLASTSYIGLLEGSLFESVAPDAGPATLDLDSLLEGARHLRLSEETGWKWNLNALRSGDVDSVGFLMAMQGNIKLTLFRRQIMSH